MNWDERGRILNFDNLKKETLDKETVVERFKLFYSTLVDTTRDAHEWAELDSIYTEDIYFCDPVHSVESRQSLHHYMSDMCDNLSECRFVYLDEVILNGTAYIKWDMYFRHPKLGNKSIQVRGVSQIEFNEKGIFYHEDFYDMGAMLYENIPLLGGGVRWLKRRLVQASA
ncbi:MAG: nuclear transport factor 2 family protein [Cellvibrionaceae bacterium]